MPKKKDQPTPSIEERLESLERIISFIEKEDLPLETLIEQYEQGSQLLQQCLQTIDQAKKRIQIVQVDLDKTLNSAHTLSENSLLDESSSHDGQLL